MRTIVSILSRIFLAAEQLAMQREITARLDEIYGPGGQDSSLDPVMAELQRRALKRNS
jgi:hypothetical protein